MFDMLERIYAAQEDYKQRLADAERSHRYSHSEVDSVQYSAILRRFFTVLGEFLIVLGMRLKAIPSVVRRDDVSNESIR